MTSPEKNYDVVIVGAGNAALTAALSAASKGVKVAILEKAPEHLRGGLFRFAYNGIEDISELLPDITSEEKQNIDVGSYKESEFYSDVMRVTEGLSDPSLLQVLTSQSFPTMLWMRNQGVPWILAYGRQAFEHEGKQRFWGGLIVEAVGGGKGQIGFSNWLNERILKSCIKLVVQICQSIKKDILKE